MSDKPKYKVYEADLEAFKPDPKNHNKHTLKGHKLVTNSMQNRGYARPAFAANDGTVLGGNLSTMEIAPSLGIGDGKVIVVETSGDVPIIHKRMDVVPDSVEARQLSYEDNFAGVLSFDLDPEIVSLDLSNGFDFEAIGVSLEELGEMLEGGVSELLRGNGQEPKDAPPQIDKAKELQAKWGTELGQVWELGEHRIVIGDCTDPAVVEAVMRGERAGISFTDPPYNVGVAYGDATNDSRLKGDFVEWCKRWLEFTPDKLLMTVGIKNLLWWDEIIGPPQWVMAWIKRNGQGQTGLKGTNKWDPILVYGVEPDSNIDIVEINNDYSDHIKGDGIHPTSKPVELWVKILNRFSSPLEIVYEPFLGTGTTLLACENLKQKCRACEIEPSYAAVTIQRWADLTTLTPNRA